MGRSITVYFAYLAKFIQARLSYRADFFASLFAAALVSFTGVLFVFFLIDGETISGLKGWRREEVLFIYGYSQIATSLFNVFAPNLYQFGDRYIIQAQFDRILLRPLNTLTQVLFESFELEALGSLFVGIGILIYSMIKLGIAFSFAGLAWFIISTISGAIILLSVFVFLASLSFHFEDRFGITPPFYNLINFSRYPLPIFNRVIQFILMWIVPFAFVGFFPATFFFAREGFEFFCFLTPVVAMVSLLLASIAWSAGVARYTSAGS